MFGRIIATAALGGTLALGGATAASATTSSTATSSAAPSSTGVHRNCANAPKALARINHLESKAHVFVTKASDRETKASATGHTRLANRIEKRIAAVEKREAHGTKLSQRIESACPGSTATS